MLFNTCFVNHREEIEAEIKRKQEELCPKTRKQLSDCIVEAQRLAKENSKGLSEAIKLCRKLDNRLVMCGNHRIIKQYMKKGRSSYNNPNGATLPSPELPLGTLKNSEAFHTTFEDLESPSSAPQS